MNTTQTTPTKPRAHFIGMGRIVEKYNPREGHHYFDPASRRWFNARLPEGGWELPSGVILFVESTRNDMGLSRGYSHPRLYSIVAMVPRKGGGYSIEKPYGFEAFANRSTANRAAEKLAKTGDPAAYFSGNLKYTAREALAAAEAWEASQRADSGVTPATVEEHRRNADHWAKAGGCRLDWSHFKPGLLLPRARREIPFADWTGRVAELHPETI